jgi:hypothetical protein
MQRERELIARLRRELPFAAQGRPALLSFLRSRSIDVRRSPRLTVIEVFDAGEQFGLMCRIALADASNAPAVFVVPMNQIALNRSHSHIRQLARSVKKLGGEGGDRSHHRR